MKRYIGIAACFLILPLLAIACQPSDQQAAPTAGKQDNAQTDLGPELPASELTTKKGLEAEKAGKEKASAIKPAAKPSSTAK